MLSQEQLIDILKALADQNRLRLFELLLHSDRTNSELMGETGLSQNLLSHHLNVLTGCGLIQSQQSIGDARRHYYSPNLDLALQINAWWQQRSPALHTRFPALKERKHVLFLCQLNAARSLMAEALARHLASGALIAHSAGIESGSAIPPVVPHVLSEHNIRFSMLAMQDYHAVLHIPFDYVITVCDRVHENSMPDELRQSEYIHWSLRDPLEEAEDEPGQLEAAHRLLHDLEMRLAFFVQRLATDETASAPQE